MKLPLAFATLSRENAIVVCPCDVQLLSVEQLGRQHVPLRQQIITGNQISCLIVSSSPKTSLSKTYHQQIVPTCIRRQTNTAVRRRPPKHRNPE